MLDDRMMDTWRRAEAGRPPLPREALEELLRPATRRTGRKLARTVWLHVALLAAAAAGALANVPLYLGNGVMLAVEGGLALASAACAAAGAVLAVRLRRIERADLPLLETIERRLALYRGAFSRWLMVAAVTPWLLAMAINTRIDAVDGTYEVNHPFEFAFVTAVMIGLTWVLQRVSLGATAFEMRSLLHDLRAQALETTPEVAAVRARTRAWMALGVALLVLGVLAGLWVWWRAG